MRVNYASMHDCELVEAGPDPAVSISASHLTAEFGKDQAAAEKKYKGMPLLIDGAIARISHKPGTGERSIFLQGNDTKASKPIQVRAEFHVDHEKSLGKLKVGQKVKIKGQFSGELNGAVFVSDVRLID